MRSLACFAVVSLFLTGCADLLGVDFEDKRLAQPQRQVITDGQLPGEYDFFGTSLDLAAGTLLIGCPAKRAYVATKQAGEKWALVQQLTNPNEARFPNGFGGSVAMSGNWALVGDWGNTKYAVPGEAFAFKRDSNGQFRWNAQRLDAGAYKHESDWFAFSLALDGTTAAIGAWGDAEFGKDAGAVYVYSLDGDVWTLERKLTLPNAAAGDALGTAVALDGDTLVASAPGRDDEFGRTDVGAVYVFTRRVGFGPEPSDELWPSAEFPSQYGLRSVAVSGDLLIAGAPEANGGQGVAYAFERSAGRWGKRPIVLPLGTENRSLLSPRARFGTSVAVDGNRAVITTRDVENRGAGFIYEKNSKSEQSAWSLVYQVSSDSGETFGYDAAVFGKTIAIGAPETDPAGAVYIYTLP